MKIKMQIQRTPTKPLLTALYNQCKMTENAHKSIVKESRSVVTWGKRVWEWEGEEFHRCTKKLWGWHICASYLVQWCFHIYDETLLKCSCLASFILLILNRKLNMFQVCHYFFFPFPLKNVLFSSTILASSIEYKGKKNQKGEER